MTSAATIRREPAALSDHDLQARVTSAGACCAGAAVPPDEWFPLTADALKARRYAWRALALCVACPVRAECLELSLRQWDDAGHYGIWGGTLEGERNGLRPKWLAGASVQTLLRSLQDVQPPGGREDPPARPRGDWVATSPQSARDPHLGMVRPVEPRSDGCADCLRAGSPWVHLRLCLTCGHVGCCDSSPLQHARRHASAVWHPVIQSLEPGEDWRWCYIDQAYV
jgi:hypothetical protein